MSAAVLSLSIAAAAVPAFAADTTSPAPAPETAKEAARAKAKADGVVCTRETPTGSHFPVKVCTTAEQRQRQNGETRRAQEEMQQIGPDIRPR
jgi:hypothetical protein